ncbi:hypothetical protein Pst134EB_025075 [Puccinia striiformis f. sp. tritici]|nr:hypothetical protein Pst134EB_025075 [Puccinia striiformis f. sp. tritici]
MHISTLLSCLLAVLVQVQAGTPPAPASAPAPLSPRKFPCPLRLYGECAYAVKKPKSGTKHPLVGEQVTLLDATEDEHNPGTWACPAKDIGIAEPSCCESQKNGFHMAREIWLKECPRIKPNRSFIFFSSPHFRNNFCHIVVDFLLYNQELPQRQRVLSDLQLILVKPYIRVMSSGTLYNRFPHGSHKSIKVVELSPRSNAVPVVAKWAIPLYLGSTCDAVQSTPSLASGACGRVVVEI